VAAGPWLAACRRGTQRLAGLRGGAAAAGRTAPPSPPPRWACSSDQPPAPAPLTPAAARSSLPRPRWPPASRRAGPEILRIAIEPARRGRALGAVVLNSMRSRPSPAACRTTSPAMSPAPRGR